MNTLRLVPLALVLTLACGGGSSEAPTPSKSEASAEAPAATPAPAPAATEAAPPAAPATPDEMLRDPKKATLTAPAAYTVKLETTKGDVLVDVHRDWAPKGADRFYNLVKAGLYDDTAFFRIVPGFVAQIGIPGDPTVASTWREARIQDDPVKETNARGTVVFATSGPNSRTTQIFINLADNPNLDGMGFAPFGTVRDMAPIDALNAEYQQTPNQAAIQMQGNAYLRAKFPNLDYIQHATVVEEGAGATPAAPAAPPAATPAPTAPPQ